MKATVFAGSLALVALMFAGAVRAEDPLGLYVGGAIGQSDVRLDRSPTDNFFGLDSNHFGWKVLVGVRPIAPFGVEAEYTDFGHVGFNQFAASGDARERSSALYGVGYLPLGAPFFDIYGKAGVARLQTTADGAFDCFAVVCGPVDLFRFDNTDTRFAYGAGVQVRLAHLGVRGEYQRIDSPLGDPALMSLGVTFTF